MYLGVIAENKLTFMAIRKLKLQNQTEYLDSNNKHSSSGGNV
jgi:hypothetical protein